jgi:serine/threonine protein kinase
MEPDAREVVEEALFHIIPRKPFPQYIDDTVFLDVQELLGKHPDKLNKAWGGRPRLYTLLRMLGHHDDTPIFQKFDVEQIGDFWLPLGPAILAQLSSAVGLSPQEWRRAQLHVLSRSELMSEEKLLSPMHTHRYIQYGSSHFEDMEMIGKGGSAEVARVRHKLSRKEFACKRILRSDTIKAQRTQLIEFEQEVGVLQRISHQHLVSFVASYTDLNSFSLILNPVAKDVLKSVLERQSREQPLPDSDISTLRHAFCCLATALAYLHEQRVRHKDIKPGNILLSEGRVYLCDFGIARDWSKAENSTTEGDVMKFTRRYCAPEVFERDPRNTKSDIWSLGCVYLEIVSVVKGYPMEEVNDFLLEHSVGASAQGLWCAPEAISAWLTKLRSDKNDSADDIPLDWITQMIRTEAGDRLRASDLLDIIHKQTIRLPHPGLFVAPCCARADSLTPADVVDSPTLHGAGYTGLGTKSPSVSPPKPYLLDLPFRNSSPSSLERRSNTSSSRHRDSRDRSVSPHTQSLDVGEVTETAPFRLDSMYDSRHEPIDPSINKPLRHISTRSDSYRAWSLSNRPQMAGSDVSSSGFRPSPVPPPTTFEVKCGCAPRFNEKHIFNAAYVSPISGDAGAPNPPFQLKSEVPTIETVNCEIGENKIQIYESQPHGFSTSNSSIPMLWWVTRRLVVSSLRGNPETRRCSSFWLPLADIQFSLIETTVTLCWSDCNQMTERSSGNYGQHYDWRYDPTRPNNNIAIRFNNINDAQQFIDVIRLPYDDGVTVSRGQKFDVADNSEINSFNVGRPGVCNYRVASLTTVSTTIVATSKLYIIWPEVDIDMRINTAQSSGSTTTPNYQMAIDIKNVATPTYHSDSRGEPAADFDRVAIFNKALQLKSSMNVTFSIGAHHSLPTPPFGKWGPSDFAQY